MTHAKWKLVTGGPVKKPLIVGTSYIVGPEVRNLAGMLVRIDRIETPIDGGGGHRIYLHPDGNLIATDSWVHPFNLRPFDLSKPEDEPEAPQKLRKRLHKTPELPDPNLDDPNWGTF